MGKPFKVTNPASINQNAEQQKRTVDFQPSKDDPSINEECVDDVPDHSPRIPWPMAKPLEQSKAPFKLRK